MCKHAKAVDSFYTRRLNNHVFSMLKACSMLEDKMACEIKQNRAPLLRKIPQNKIYRRNPIWVFMGTKI